jgi:hypothetical protein
LGLFLKYMIIGIVFNVYDDWIVFNVYDDWDCF